MTRYTVLIAYHGCWAEHSRYGVLEDGQVVARALAADGQAVRLVSEVER